MAVDDAGCTRGRGQGDGKGKGGDRVGVGMGVGSDGGRGPNLMKLGRVKEKILGLVGPMGGRDMAFFHPLKDPAACCLNGRWRQWRGYHEVAGGCG